MCILGLSIMCLTVVSDDHYQKIMQKLTYFFSMHSISITCYNIIVCNKWLESTGMPNITVYIVHRSMYRSNACSAKTLYSIYDCQVENPANFSYGQSKRVRMLTS